MRNEVLVLRAACEAVADRAAPETRSFHGYEVLLRLRRAAEAAGHRPMNQATVYRGLRRMEEAGIIDGAWEDPAEGERDRPLRRIYTLADDAEQVLAQEAALLDA